MELLANWAIRHGSADRKIELLQGDLARLPPEHAVDVLVVSAFPNDYSATPGSVIGALDRSGLSVLSLSCDKQVDLRQQYSCWLSKPVKTKFNFRHLLCVESGWGGTAPDITNDIFRALSPYLLSEFPNSAVAIPLICAGEQGWPAEQMLQAILRAAVNWLERGLPMQVLKIVVRSEEAARASLKSFISYRQGYQIEQLSIVGPGEGLQATTPYDVFLSYSHKDAEMAMLAVDELSRTISRGRIFYDRGCLREGGYWPIAIANALDSSRRVVTLYSPGYWASRSCQLEFLAVFARQNDSSKPILFPIYLQDATIPYMFKSVQYVDCRVNDTASLARACVRLAAEIS